MHMAYISDAIIYLLASVVVIAIAFRFKTSSVLLYLLMGIIIGPFGMHLITNVQESRSFAELGLVFLFFAMGLELPLPRLKILKKYMFGLGGAQVAVTTSVFHMLALTLGMTKTESFLIASSLALSSTAVVIQILSDMGHLAARHGRISFAVLLFQDIAVVILLELFPIFKNEIGGSTFVILALLRPVVGIMMVMAVGRFVIRPLYHYFQYVDHPDLLMALTLLVILGMATFASNAGVSYSLGAFIVGVLLAETEYRHRIEESIQPFRGLLMGLFFMTVGMMIDTKILKDYFVIIIMLTFLIIIIKSSILFMLCRFLNMYVDTSVRVSLLLSTGGEFAFILLSPNLIDGVVPSHIAQIVLLAASLSLALTQMLRASGERVLLLLEAKKLIPPVAVIINKTPPIQEGSKSS